MVLRKITEQTREEVWEQFIVNVCSVAQFRGLFERQPRAGARTRYIINVSSSAIHYNTGSYPLGCGTLTKYSAALLLQKAADESDLSKTQIINFHPSAILTLVGKGASLTADSADWDHVLEDLPGSFAVWAASLEAAFLRSRFV
ncbi:hypothetical protein FOC1_g10003835 [Fusarium oxysporum f. sp. cubense race 1]|uniref:Uncharacterized protein n=1 Tax=Fusarium oxysporum f. sp. cubense (strain race 1) TaxID=1229664 RepID=N4V3T4_FUSC1|nr:hypothetical protein FOC1_g10003835 [Fusarium oxysporum f. sp. cubense race 1]